MSYASLFKSLPEKLTQPIGIAILASLGIHVLVGFTLPYWSGSSNGKSKPIRNVKLVQLPQSERNRIPTPSSSPLTLPPSVSQQLQPLPPLPSSLNTPLPAPPKDSSVYNFPLTPLPSLGNLNLSPISPSPRRRPSSLKLPVFNSPLRNDLLSQLSAPRKDLSLGTSTVKPDFLLPPKPNSALPPPPPAFLPPPPNPASPLPGGVLPGAVPEFATNPGQASNPSDSLSATSPVAVNPSTTGLDSPWSAPGVGTTLPTETTQAAVPGSLPGNSTGSNSGSNYDAYQRNVINWQERTQTYSRPKEVLIANNSIPKNAAAGESANGEVYIAVKVDEKGNIISNSLDVMGSSFSDASFDGSAKDAVQNYRFQGTGKVEAYVVRVQFNGGSRGAGSVIESPTPGTRQNAPKPDASPESLNTPKPGVSPEQTTTPTSEPTSDRISTPKPDVSPERLNPTKPETSSERVNAPKPDASPASNRLNAPKPDASPDRVNLPKPDAPSQRLSLPKLPDSSPASEQRPSTAKPEASSERLSPPRVETSPQRLNAPKPETSPQRLNAPKPDVSPERPSTFKPEASSDRSSTPKPEASSDRPSSSRVITPLEGPRSPKPEASAERSNSSQPEASPDRSSDPKPEN